MLPVCNLWLLHLLYLFISISKKNNIHCWRTSPLAAEKMMIKLVIMVLNNKFFNLNVDIEEYMELSFVLTTAYHELNGEDLSSNRFDVFKII